jgi:hypothetical protein
MFWKKFPDVYLSMNDDPVLKIDWYDRHLMDVGVMEETYEYYRAKKMKSNEEYLDIERWNLEKINKNKIEISHSEKDSEGADDELYVENVTLNAF